jgi:hypothetical protein
MNPLVNKDVHHYVKDLIDDHLPDAEKEDQGLEEEELDYEQRRRAMKGGSNGRADWRHC